MADKPRLNLAKYITKDKVNSLNSILSKIKIPVANEEAEPYRFTPEVPIGTIPRPSTNTLEPTFSEGAVGEAERLRRDLLSKGVTPDIINTLTIPEANKVKTIIDIDQQTPYRYEENTPTQGNIPPDRNMVFRQATEDENPKVTQAVYSVIEERNSKDLQNDLLNNYRGAGTIGNRYADVIIKGLGKSITSGFGFYNPQDVADLLNKPLNMLDKAIGEKYNIPRVDLSNYKVPGTEPTRYMNTAEKVLYTMSSIVPDVAIGLGLAGKIVKPLTNAVLESKTLGQALGFIEKGLGRSVANYVASNIPNIIQTVSTFELPTLTRGITGILAGSSNAKELGVDMIKEGIMGVAFGVNPFNKKLYNTLNKVANEKIEVNDKAILDKLSKLKDVSELSKGGEKNVADKLLTEKLANSGISENYLNVYNAFKRGEIDKRKLIDLATDLVKKGDIKVKIPQELKAQYTKDQIASILYDGIIPPTTSQLADMILNGKSWDSEQFAKDAAMNMLFRAIRFHNLEGKELPPKSYKETKLLESGKETKRIAETVTTPKGTETKPTETITPETKPVESSIDDLIQKVDDLYTNKTSEPKVTKTESGDAVILLPEGDKPEDNIQKEYEEALKTIKSKITEEESTPTVKISEDLLPTQITPKQGETLNGDEKEINKSIAKMYVNPDDNDVILNEANNIESRIDKISDNTEKERISNEVKQLKTNLKENTNAINERELPENNQPEYKGTDESRETTEPSSSNRIGLSEEIKAEETPQAKEVTQTIPNEPVEAQKVPLETRTETKEVNMPPKIITANTKEEKEKVQQDLEDILGTLKTTTEPKQSSKQKVSPIEQKVAPIEQKEEKPIAQKESKAYKVFDVPIDDINTATDLFQNRDEEYSEESVNSIVKAKQEGNFDLRKFDPIRIWKNPKDNKYYVVAGHSRLEAFKRLSDAGNDEFKHIPAIIMEGDNINEVKKYALEESNALGTQESLTARAKIYRQMRESGASDKEIKSKVKSLEKKNAPLVYALSMLNPKGSLIKSYKMLDSSTPENRAQVEKIISMVGRARETYDKLTNQHEEELFNYLLKNANKFKGSTDFVENKLKFLIESYDFDYGKPLNIENKPTTPQEADYRKQLREYESQISEAEKRLKEKRDEYTKTKIAELNKLKEGTPEYEKTKVKLEKNIDEALEKIRSEISYLTEQKVKHESSFQKYLDAANEQNALFEKGKKYDNTGKGVLKEKGEKYGKRKIYGNNRVDVKIEHVLDLEEGTIFNNRGDVDLRAFKTLPEGLEFNNGGDVILENLQSLPKNITFNNHNNIDLASLKTLPNGIKFNNNGTVFLDDLTEIPEGFEFNNNGDVRLGSLKVLPKNVKFNNNRSIYLDNVEEIPEGYVFENKKDVVIYSLKVLPKNVKFNNNGSVFAEELEKISEGVEFNNRWNVNLSLLEILPEDVKFNNKGSVSLEKLKTIPNGFEFNDNGSVKIGSLEVLPKDVKFNNKGSIVLNDLKELPEDFEFHNAGAVFLQSLKYLPKNVKFLNGGDVDLRDVEKIERGVKFKNDGDVILLSAKEISEGVEFHNEGNVNLDLLKVLPKGIKFNNKGDVLLRRLDIISEGVEFNNLFDVNLNSLKVLPKDIKFNNKGDIRLTGLEEIQEGFEFNSKIRDVYLNSLKILPKDVKFQNKGEVYLPKLENMAEGTVFNNEGIVSLDEIKVIPKNVKFNNGNGVEIENVIEIQEGVEFNNEGEIRIYGLKTLPKDVKFNNTGRVTLGGLEKIPDGFEFNNEGNLILPSIEKLPKNVKFNKQKSIVLKKIKELPEGFVFDNNGDIDLESLKILPKDVKFNNKGGVYLRQLREISEGVEFNNTKDIRFDNLDNLPNGIKLNNNGDIYLLNIESISGGYKFNNNGGIFLSSLKKLPNDIEFNNKGGVYLEDLEELPEGYVFNNGGDVDLKNLKELPKGVEFNNEGLVNLNSLMILPKDIKFNNKGNVYLDNSQEISEGAEFNNGGNVSLGYLATLSKDIKFNNKGNVYLGHLDELTEGYEFSNAGNVSLNSLETLPKGVKFNNVGDVSLNSAKGIPEDVEFNNEGDVYLKSLTKLPENVKFNNNGDIVLKDGVTIIKNIKSVSRIESILQGVDKPKRSFTHKYHFVWEKVPGYTLDAKGKDWRINIYSNTDKFPDEIYDKFNLHHVKGYKPLGWIGGRYDKDTKTLYVTEIQSDLLQRTQELSNKWLDENSYDENHPFRKWVSLRSQIENEFDGWYYVFFNTAMKDWIERAKTKGYEIESIKLPTPDYYTKHIPGARNISSIYERIANRYNHETERDWNVINPKNIATEKSEQILDYYDVYIEAYIKNFVEEQKKLTPDLASDKELAYDGLKFLSDDANIKPFMESKQGIDFISKYVIDWIEKTFSEEKPKGELSNTTIDESGNIVDKGEGGILVTPEGEELPEEQSDVDDIIKKYEKVYIPTFDKFDTDDLLDMLSEANKNKDKQRAEVIKQMLSELNYENAKKVIDKRLTDDNNPEGNVVREKGISYNDNAYDDAVNKIGEYWYNKLGDNKDLWVEKMRGEVGDWIAGDNRIYDEIKANSDKYIEPLQKAIENFAKLGITKIEDVADEISHRGLDNLLKSLPKAYRKFKQESNISPAIKNEISNDEQINKWETDYSRLPENREDKNRETELQYGQRVTPADGRKGNYGRRPALRYFDEESVPEPKNEIIKADRFTDSKGAEALDEHQRYAVNLALEHFSKGGKSFLIGDGPGVGKTREILAIAKYSIDEYKKPVLIVVPNNTVLEESFKPEAKAMRIGLSQFDIGTYDDLTHNKIGKEDYGLVIFDEAHSLKNADSIRAIISSNVKADRKVFATATPLDNPKAAIYFLSEITGEGLDNISKELGIKYETDEQGNITAVVDEKIGVDELVNRLIKLRQKAIKNGQMIRREYPFWGNINTYSIKPNDEFLETQNKINEYYAKKIKNILRANFPNTDKIAMSYGQARQREISALTEIQKVDDIFELALKDLSNNKKVIIVAEGINPTELKSIGIKIPGFLSEMAKKFKNAGIEIAKIYGADKEGKIKEVERFQSDKVNVALMTPKSGGVGISLDDQTGYLNGGRQRSMYIATANYSGDMLQQIIYRVSRRNSKSPSDVNISFLENSLNDERRKEIARGKIRVAKAMQEGQDIDKIEYSEGLQIGDVSNNIIMEGRSKYGLDEGLNKPVFYSQLEKVAESKIPEKATPQQIKATLLNNGVKQSEYDWLGIDEYLKGKDKVNKKELMDFIAENKVVVDKIILGKRKYTDKEYEELVRKQKLKDEQLREKRERENERKRKEYYLALKEYPDKIKEAKDYMIKSAEEYGKIMNDFKQNSLTPEEREIADKYGIYITMQGYPEAIGISSEESGEEQERHKAEMFPVINKFEAFWKTDKVKQALDEYKRANGQYVSLSINRPKPKRPIPYETKVKNPPLLPTKFKGWITPGGDNYKEVLLTLPYQKDIYSEGHYKQHPALHIRIQDFEDSNGKKILLVDEVQSDWGEAGRKLGYGGRVPDFPFKKNWQEVGMKWALRYAAENGYDGIAWTNGERQSNRYSLAKQTSRVEVKSTGDKYHMIAYGIGGEESKPILDKIITKDELEVNLGKDITKKVLEEGQEVFVGEDLKVGGEGMRVFYDKMLPDFINKYTKKWNGRVREIELKTDIPNEKFHYLEITPEMEKSVIEGQALFEKPQFGGYGLQSIEVLDQYRRDIEKKFLETGKQIYRQELDAISTRRKEMLRDIKALKETAIKPVKGQLDIFGNEITEPDNIQENLFPEEVSKNKPLQKVSKPIKGQLDIFGNEVTDDKLFDTEKEKLTFNQNINKLEDNLKEKLNGTDAEQLAISLQAVRELAKYEYGLMREREGEINNNLLGNRGDIQEIKEANNIEGQYNTRGDIGEAQRLSPRGIEEQTTGGNDIDRQNNSIRRIEEIAFDEEYLANTKKLIESGSVEVTGKTFNGLEDLMFNAQVYRDPRFESFRLFYIKNNADGTMTIVGHRIITSGIPNLVRLPNDLNDIIKDDMKALGSDRVVIMHNHPSANPEPSAEDISITKKIMANNDKVYAHIISNHGKFSVMRKGDEGFSSYDMKLGNDPLIHFQNTSYVGQKISPSSLAQIGKDLVLGNNHVVLFGANPYYEINYATEINVSDIKNLKDTLFDLAHKTGSSRFFVVIPKNAILEPGEYSELFYLVDRNYLVDVTDATNMITSPGKPSLRQNIHQEYNENPDISNYLGKKTEIHNNLVKLSERNTADIDRRIKAVSDIAYEKSKSDQKAFIKTLIDYFGEEISNDTPRLYFEAENRAKEYDKICREADQSEENILHEKGSKYDQLPENASDDFFNKNKEDLEKISRYYIAKNKEISLGEFKNEIEGLFSSQDIPFKLTQNHYEDLYSNGLRLIMESERRIRQATEQNLGERAFTKRVKASEDVSEKVKLEMESDFYKAISNKETLNKVLTWIETDGQDNVISQIMSNNAEKTGEVIVMAGEILTKKLSLEAEKLWSEGKVIDGQKTINIVANLIDKISAEQGTLAGRTIQAFATWDLITPQGALNRANRELEPIRKGRIAEIEGKLLELKNSLDELHSKQIDELLKKHNDELNELLKQLDEAKKGNITNNLNSELAFADYENRIKELKTILQNSKEPELKSQIDELNKRIQQSEWVIKGLKSRIVTSNDTNKIITLISRINDLLSGGVQDIVNRIKSGDLKGTKEILENVLTAQERIRGAAELLSRKVINSLKPKVQQPPDIVKQMANTLFKIAKENGLVPEQEPLTKIKLAEIVGKAVKMEGEYLDVWEKAKKVVEEKYKNDPKALEQLQDFFNHYLENPFSEAQIKSIVSEGLKDLEIRLREVIKKHYSVAEGNKAKLIDKIIEEAGLEGEDTEAVKRFIDKIGKEYDERIEDLSKKELDRIFKKVESKKRKELLDKIIEMSNLGALTYNEYRNLFAEKVGIDKILSDEEIREILKLSNKIQELPEGSIQQQKMAIKLLDYIEDLKGRKASDIYWEYYFASILSGLSTQLKNSVENTLMTIDGLTNAPPEEVPGRLMHAIKSLNVSLPETMSALKGEPVRHLEKGKYETSRILERTHFRGGWFNPLSWAKVPSRLLKAMDVLAYYPNQEMEMYSLAYKRAKLMKDENGNRLKGRKLQEKINEIMNETPASVEKAKQQAKDEGLTGRDFVRRVNQIIEQGRDKELMEQAQQFGRFNTFNNKPYGAIGAIAEAVNTLVRKKWGKLTRFIVPFTNVVSNVFNMSLNYTPVGVLRGIYGRKVGFENWGRKLTEGERNDFIIRGIKGTLLFMILGALTALKDKDGKPLLRITSTGPGDYEKRKQTGRLQYSFEIGNISIPYQYISPILIPMTVFGTIQDLMRYGKGESMEKIDLITTSLLQSMASVLDMNFMSGVAKMLRAVDPNRPKSEGKYLENLAIQTTNPLFPNALKQLYRLIDPTVYEAHSFTERLLKNIGVAQSQLGLKPAIDLLGEPVTQDRNKIFVYTGIKLRDDKVWNFIAGNGAWITTPDKGTLIWDSKLKKDRALTEEEYYNYIKISGQEIKQNIAKNLDNLNKLNQDDKRKVVGDIVKRARENALLSLTGRGDETKEYDFTAGTATDIITKIKHNIRSGEKEKNDEAKKELTERVKSGMLKGKELNKANDLLKHWDKNLKLQDDLTKINTIIEKAGIKTEDGKAYQYNLAEYERDNYSIDWKRLSGRLSDKYQYISPTTGKKTDSMIGALARKLNKGEIERSEAKKQRDAILKARQEILNYKTLKNK